MKSKLNVALLRKVKRHMLADPRRLQMSQALYVTRGKNAPHCGTVGCIAGWVVALSRAKKGETSKHVAQRFDNIWCAVEGEAASVLGLSIQTLNNLFFVSS